ncbi:MAG: right-handed parallel beta-helix repeat-containing protein [Desulfuromonadales bacterium]|nr:right-handed parallel beta-helix repeat-containing protein [Desulfuromonadales bacterium]
MSRPLLLLILLLLLLPLPAAALTISTDTTWRGERNLHEMVRVAPEVTLTIAPDSVVHFSGGGLEVAGVLRIERSRIDGSGWSGIELKNCDQRTVLRDSVISGARTAVLIGGGAPHLERLILTDNDVGVEVRRKSAALITACVFEKNRKVGLFVKDEAIPVVEGCRFSANGKYGAYIYRAVPQRFVGNQFAGNPTGLMIAYYGSDAQISANHFTANGVAIEIDRAARPVVRGNRLTGNETGIRLYRRSDAQISGNLLARNRIAISVAYSSYPEISTNDFIANQKALVLEYQSSLWERERGSSERQSVANQQGAFGRKAGTPVSETERRPRLLDGKVRAMNNWWGAQGTAELARSGAQGNPSFIDDGRDTPTFVEGGKDYPLDIVVFTPWRTQAATTLQE